MREGERMERNKEIAGERLREGESKKIERGKEGERNGEMDKEIERRRKISERK